MTTTDHPSGLPEQEPTSHTVAVLCDGETWAKTGDDWESPRHFCSWGGLRNLAADRGGAALFDLADLRTGLSEAQKEAVRTAEAALTACGSDVSAGVLREAFPGVFADGLVTVTWKSGDSDETWAELLRVARMDVAHVVGTQSGVTHSGLVFAAQHDCVLVGTPGISIPLWGVGWTVTVTAPKPVGPGADIPDEVVDAALAAIPWASVHQRADLRAVLAAADAKRAELEGGEGNE